MEGCGEDVKCDEDEGLCVVCVDLDDDDDELGLDSDELDLDVGRDARDVLMLWILFVDNEVNVM